MYTLHCTWSRDITALGLLRRQNVLESRENVSYTYKYLQKHEDVMPWRSSTVSPALHKSLHAYLYYSNDYSHHHKYRSMWQAAKPECGYPGLWFAINTFRPKLLTCFRTVILSTPVQMLFNRKQHKQPHKNTNLLFFPTILSHFSQNMFTFLLESWCPCFHFHNLL